MTLEKKLVLVLESRRDPMNGGRIDRLSRRWGCDDGPDRVGNILYSVLLYVLI